MGLRYPGFHPDLDRKNTTLSFPENNNLNLSTSAKHAKVELQTHSRKMAPQK